MKKLKDMSVGDTFKTRITDYVYSIHSFEGNIVHLQRLDGAGKALSKESDSLLYAHCEVIPVTLIPIGKLVKSAAFFFRDHTKMCRFKDAIGSDALYLDEENSPQCTTIDTIVLIKA